MVTGKLWNLYKRTETRISLKKNKAKGLAL